MAQTTYRLPTITLPTTGAVTSIDITTRKSDKTITTSTSRDHNPTTAIDTKGTPTNTNAVVKTIVTPSSASNIDPAVSIVDSRSTDAGNIQTDVVGITQSNTSSAVDITAVTDTGAVATATTTTVTTTTASTSKSNNDKSGGHLPPWIIPTISVIASLVFIWLAMFYIRRSSSRYRRRKLMGESNEEFIREVDTNGDDGIEKFGQSSFSGGTLGNEFNSKNRGLGGNNVDGAIGFPAVGGYNQGISHDITDVRAGFGVNLTTEDDDPFSDTTFAEDTSSFKNVSPSHQLYQNSDVTGKVRARELPKLKTSDLAGMLADDNESPSIHSDSFSFHGVPFQDNDRAESRPTLRSTLSRTPTVISAFSEMIEPFPLSLVPPLLVNITGDENDTDSSIKDVGNASGNGSLSSNVNNGDLSVSGKDDEAESRSLAEELSTALTISSAIESTALPILSTYDCNVFTEEPLDGIDPEGPHGDIMEQSQDNTEGSHAFIME